MRLLQGRRVDDRTFELVFGVAEGALERHASVRVTRFGQRVSAVFPHDENDLGETLGDSDYDRALLERAEHIVALLRAQGEWRRFDP